MLHEMGCDNRLDAVGVVAVESIPQDLKGGNRKLDKCDKPEDSYEECV